MSKNKFEDGEFFMLNSHTKGPRRQLEEAILLDWAQGRGVFRLGKREFLS